jgi:hypothetical protein
MAYVEGQELPLLATEAQARDTLAGAMAAAAAQQADAGRFIVEYGAQVLGGHSDVGLVEVHNVGADPDTGGADAADTHG